jgi:hypothetical protein
LAILTVTYLKIPHQMRLQRQLPARQAASYIEGFPMVKELGLFDRSILHLLAKPGHLAHDAWGSAMEFPEARFDDMPEVFLGSPGDGF